MGKGLSNQVRRLAMREFVEGVDSKQHLEISLGDIQQMLLKDGFPSGHLRQIRTALESSLFWEQAGLRLMSAKGQPDRVGTVLVFGSAEQEARSGADRKKPENDPLLELRGLLRGAIREGAAAFLKELREDKEVQSERNDTEHAA